MCRGSKGFILCRHLLPPFTPSLFASTARQAGGVSEHLHSDLKPGAVVRVTVGGDFTLTDCLGAPPDSDSKVLLLSAGIGVTPTIGSLRWLQQRRAERLSSDKNRCLRHLLREE